MDTTALIIEHASVAGVAGSAMPDVLARSSAHFGAKEVSAETVQQFLTTLKDTAPHLFAMPLPPASRTATVGADLPVWLSPSERASRYRALHPQAPVQRRPAAYTPTPEQLQSLEGKSATERLTLYREWQTTAHGGTA